MRGRETEGEGKREKGEPGALKTKAGAQRSVAPREITRAKRIAAVGSQSGPNVRAPKGKLAEREGFEPSVEF